MLEGCGADPNRGRIFAPGTLCPSEVIMPHRSLVLVVLLLAAGGGCGGGTGGGGGGGAPQTLTFPTGVRGGSPRFGLDGSQIAYQREEGDGYGVAVMQVNGDDSRTLATDANYLTAMTWTRDGAEIIYYANNGIRAVPAAGGTGRLVVNAFAAMGPDLSPDGNSLVYGTNGGTMQLADLRSSPAVESDLGVEGRSPRFSPDGTRIAFFDGTRVALMDLGTKAVTSVVDSAADFGGVDWFRDGQRLLAGTDRGIEILKLGPPVERTLVKDVFALMDVDLSPDDHSVAYGVNGQPDLYVLGL
jgi:Tol biopolymer transport system component